MADLGTTRRRLAEARRQRGLWATAALGVEEAFGRLRHGSASGGTAAGAARAADATNDAERLETTSFRTLRRTLAAVPADVRGTGFVDLGCGRGRVLRAAVDRGYAPVVGVERDAAVAADARSVVGGRAEVVEADAATFPLPDHAGVIFLSNPFGPSTLAAVMAALEASQRRGPRPLVVVYVNPVHRALVEAAGFRPVWQDADAVVLRRDSVQNWNAF